MNELPVLNNCGCGCGEGECGCAAVAAAKERPLWRPGATESNYW